MATSRSFSTMLNQYLPYDLLMAEFEKRMYLLQNVKKSNDWKGGDLIVPFEGACPSSVSFGSLAASTDIAEAEYVRGSISSVPEVWFTLLFNERDFLEHEGTKKEQSFLRSLRNQMPKAMDFFKTAMSQNWLAGPHFATLTANGDAAGNITVDRPERFVRGQKVHLLNSTPTSVTGFVRSINMNTNIVNLVTARGGAIALNCAAFTTALSSKVYYQGLIDTAAHAVQNSFTSLTSSLLSNANGGSATLYGQTKATYPFLQAINESGTAVTAASILSDIFDAFVSIDRKSPGNPNEILMSYKNFGNCMKGIDVSKGAFQQIPGSVNSSKYKWRSIEVGSPSGYALKLVAVPEMNDSEIIFMDWKSVELHSNGFFRIAEDQGDGNKLYRTRATTGFTYLADMCFYGDLVLHDPSVDGIMYGISY